MDYLTNTMLEILKFFYAVGGHNYGLAIIWLTVAVNLALYPLTLTSVKQMSAMQKIQPRLKELQKKYKDEPQKLQKEMMDMYKGEGVNPLGGCLPMLLKIPFFLALFFALQSNAMKALLISSTTGTSFLWINNLAKPDPLWILPVLIGVSTWYMQKTMPAMGEQAQIMNWFMPIFIVLISYAFPAGVQLYWVVSNVMGGAQQAYIMSRPVKEKVKKATQEGEGQ